MDDVSVIRIRRLLKTETDAELIDDLHKLMVERETARKQITRLTDEIAVIETELARRGITTDKRED